MKLKRPQPESKRRPKAAEVLAEPEPEVEVPFDPRREIREADWDGLKQLLNEFRSANSWGRFSGLAMRMKLLFPDRTEELGLDQKAFEGMKQILDQVRLAKDWGLFSSQAMHMTILSADRAEITPAGQIKLTQTPKPLRAPRPLPERPQV